MFNVHIVVVHACHGHRYRPSPVPLSGTGKKGGGSKGVEIRLKLPLKVYCHDLDGSQRIMKIKENQDSSISCGLTETFRNT